MGSTPSGVKDPRDDHPIGTSATLVPGCPAAARRRAARRRSAAATTSSTATASVSARSSAFTQPRWVKTGWSDVQRTDMPLARRSRPTGRTPLGRTRLAGNGPSFVSTRSPSRTAVIGLRVPSAISIMVSALRHLLNP